MRNDGIKAVAGECCLDGDALADTLADDDATPADVIEFYSQVLAECGDSDWAPAWVTGG